jgi:hypothetical protein
MIVRLRSAWWADSGLPRDQLIINPVFRINGLLYDPQQLCQDLATSLQSWAAVTTQLIVTAYDVQGTKPVYPAGRYVHSANTFFSLSGFREQSLCLSFYSDHNVPRQRGRLYVPNALAYGSTIGQRPTSTQRNKVSALVPIFANLGGANVDWVVWSQMDRAARKVSNWWVDDEWDVQRRRGLRQTTRDTGTTSGRSVRQEDGSVRFEEWSAEELGAVAASAA